MATAGLVMTEQAIRNLFEERKPYIDEILFNNYAEPKMIFDMIFNMRTSNRMAEDVVGLAGFGKFTEKPQAQKLDYDTIIEAFWTRFTHKTFAKGYQISMELNEDEMDGVIVEMAPALGRMARISQEADAMSVFSTGFSTLTSPDGAAFFSASHVNAVGQTSITNLITGDFAQATLETVLNQYADLTDERGELILMNPTRIITGPELRWQVAEVLESTQKAGTANNDINVMSRLGLQHLWSPFITADDDWFMCPNQNEHRLIWYWRRMPVTDHAVDFDTKNLKTSMLYSYSYGVADWRGWFGGQGA